MSNHNASLPEYIKIGPYTWSILDAEEDINKAAVHSGTSLYGYTDPDTQRILVHPGMEPDIEADIVVHEVLHAIMHVSGSDISSKKEESLIRSISSTVLAVIRDNPKLVEYWQGVE